MVLYLRYCLPLFSRFDLLFNCCLVVVGSGGVFVVVVVAVVLGLVFVLVLVLVVVKAWAVVGMCAGDG